ncbi:pyridoxal phosphate-dependent aminotransferase [Aquirufa nivalisilvae]|jgi:aspartate aminotransferase|uniref:Aminotransferase n=1 Tax=Aquirufa nivalisilvae TaxID=2516557 RepID=A0A2S2DSJ8_9BACT|nr:pyridoxal phosphate-dependent aminotransferase [Aquirufa nivalisilvae]AWL08346.1 Aspartate transaminase [Aquirufa nivalisilvae]MCZ2478816.1 pyridoxal phosphate-dependent aminotransferase [Aquirufa nivalisilvae]MCZ2483552.1 pyridoxal phosphate-dependent aminotransferase [Aquirufa nivalisilvae]TBH75747.1 pyridoxal phosphate-dependent aminotransferase [Aquirufa nivalisilvae]
MSSSLLAQRIQALEESSTLGMTKKARELAAQGHKVISLSVGEPDFKTPAHICEAAKKAIDDGFHGYSPVAGYPDLRMAIANKLKRDNGLEWASENIVVSTGAKHSLANAIAALIDPGDEVIIFSPYWVSYSEMVKLAEGTSVIVQGSFENNFKVTAEQFEAAITPKTKMVMFASPNNPTGSVYTESELRDIANVVARHERIFVLADEIYEYINFTQGGHFSIGSIPEIKDRVITVNGVAKGHAMTGWRIGFIAAAKWIADGVEKLQGQVTSGTNSIAQKAAVAAFNGTLDHAYEMKAAYDRRRKLVVGKLREIEGFKVNMPDGAFYAFPDISYFYGKSDGKTTINDSDDFCNWLLQEAYVATVAGSGFGAPNCMRISTAAADEQLEEACERIKNAVAKLK